MLRFTSRPLAAIIAATALMLAPLSLAASPLGVNSPGPAHRSLTFFGLIRAEGESVAVEKAWARASAGNASTAAAYLTLTGGSAPDRLVGASTPAAEAAELHESFTEGGLMRMRPVGVLPIPAGRTISLSPGGYHFMLTGLKAPLVPGRSFPLTLRFEHTPPVTVDVQVRPIGPGTSMDGSAATEGHMHMQ